MFSGRSLQLAAVLLIDYACQRVGRESWVDVFLRFRVFQPLGGGGCNKYVPVLGGDGTKIAPPADLFDQPPGEIN